MGFFEGRKSGRGDAREGMTLVGEEAYFRGLLAVKGSLRVEGVVEGDVTDAVAVEVGKNGRIKGNIAAESVSIAGAVEGDVIASRHVELLAQCRLRGNLRVPSLSIQEGAVFDGACVMSSADRQSSKGGKHAGREPVEAVEEVS